MTYSKPLRTALARAKPSRNRSFIVPLYERQEFIDFLFYDSLKPAAFSKKVQRSL